VNNKFRYRIAQQAIKAVNFIHKNDVIHSNLSARQFLVDEKLNIRLSDFGGSSLRGSEAIVMEIATHFLPWDKDSPNTV
jgi:serine/threonine protein kinase